MHHAEAARRRTTRPLNFRKTSEPSQHLPYVFPQVADASAKRPRTGVKLYVRSFFSFGSKNLLLRVMSRILQILCFSGSRTL